MLEYEVKVMLALKRAKNAAVQGVKDFFLYEDGDTNLISIVVVLVIVLGLAVVFRKNIVLIVNKMWESIFQDAEGATNTSIGGGEKFQ